MSWKVIRLIDRYVGIPLVYAFICVMTLIRRLYPVDEGHAAKRILLIKFWGIGNLFLMLPAVTMLRNIHPGVHLDILTLESNRDAALQIQAFRGIILVSTRSFRVFISSLFSALKSLRRNDYDIVIDFEQFSRFSSLCAALISRKKAIGFNTASQRRHFLYSHPVKYYNTVHISQAYRSLALASGAATDSSGNVPVPFFLNCSERSASYRLPKFSGRADAINVLLHVGTSSNFSERRWPTASFAILADLLIQNHDARVILGGLAEEKFIAAEVTAQSRFGKRIVDTCGTLSFQGYYDLICLSDLVVSADTMAVHVASASGVPVVGLYGPNTPDLYGPWGAGGRAIYKRLECSPCITNFNAKMHTCRHPNGKGACMKKIDPEEVYEEIRMRYFNIISAVQLRGRAGAKPCSR